MRLNFTHRSTELELLDGENIPTQALYQNLKELAFINTYLGGFQITIQGIASFITDKNKLYHLVDIGCGGGDNMLAIARWAKKNKYQVKLTGVDLKEDAIAYAKENCKAFPNIEFLITDYKKAQFNTQVDLIVSSLFCHHLTHSQVLECLGWMQKTAKMGFIINDLQRNKIAYYSIKFLTALFSKSYLVKNDAAVSVSRGFKKNEFQKLMQEAGLTQTTIEWKWAFRYLVIAKL